ESAGKRRSGKPRQGNRWLRATLLEAAWAATRTDTALAARYRRVMRRRGHKKAIIAVAHAMLVIAYHVLHDRTTYPQLGPTSPQLGPRHAAQPQAVRARRRPIRTRGAQGYRVVPEPAA